MNGFFCSLPNRFALANGEITMKEKDIPQAQSLQLTQLATGHTMRDFMGPLLIDQAVRQAIQHCWMLLPQEERNVARVRQEIEPLVQRALKDFEEDAVVFNPSASDETD
jgi:hypothetical protein